MFETLIAIAITTLFVIARVLSKRPAGRGRTAARTEGLVGTTVQARVLHVNDGDGLVVAIEGYRPVKVRLADVDAPEYDQPGGQEAKHALHRLVRTGPLTLTVRDEDHYGRLVANVRNADGCVGRALVRQGHAWHYAKYTPRKDRRAYRRLEREARKERRGLWGETGRPVAPWNWRNDAKYA